MLACLPFTSTMQMLSGPSQVFPVGGIAKGISSEMTEDLVCQGAAAESTNHQETSCRWAMQGIMNNMFHIPKEWGLLCFWHGNLANDIDTSLGPQLCSQRQIQKAFPGWYEQEESVWRPWTGNLQMMSLKPHRSYLGSLLLLPIIILEPMWPILQLQGNSRFPWLPG